MRSIRKAIAWAFRPPLWAVALLALASAVGLVWCFAFGGEGTLASYAIYLLSSYALAVAVVAAVPSLKAAWRRIAGTRVIAPFVQDESLRAGVSGAWAVAFDLAYALFILVTALAYDSNWALAVALYHVAIAGIGFTMVAGLRRIRKLPQGERRRRELGMVSAIGILLFVMALALSGVMAQMVLDKRAWVYGTIVVITSATFTFVNLGLAIAGMVRVRRVDRPSLVASRGISLSKTLVQLFFLETTMIAVFGQGDEAFRFAMEAATGAVVFLLVLAIAVCLVIFARRETP